MCAIYTIYTPGRAPRGGGELKFESSGILKIAPRSHPARGVLKYYPNSMFSFLGTQLFKCLVKHYFIDDRFSEVRGSIYKVKPELHQSFERVLAARYLLESCPLLIDNVSRFLKITFDIFDSSIRLLEKF